MASGHHGAVLQQIHRLFSRGTAAGLGERQLLDRFITQRDEAAFEALVARHGPMVLGVCRRLLHSPHDVEDAFRATFLILVRRAGSIRQRELLANWLYGVAHRVAARSRANELKRSELERPGAMERIEDQANDRVDQDQSSALHEEVQLLPARYRAPVVLCYLQGRTNDEASAQLGCPVGTVKSRLARARELLRGRLIRRGVSLTAGSVSLVLSEKTASAAVPLTLVDATVQAAAHVALGRAATGTIPTSVASLTGRVLKTMWWSNLRKIAALTLMIGLVSTSVVVMVFHLSAAEFQKAETKDGQLTPTPAESKQKPEPPAQAKPPNEKPAPQTPVRPGDRLVIEVLEALPGRPINGERAVRPDGTISLGYYGDLPVAGLTRSEIKVKLIVHLRKYLSDEPLGLVAVDARTGEPIPIPPLDSDRVFVDDYVDPSQARHLEEIDRKLGEILRELKDLNRKLPK